MSERILVYVKWRAEKRIWEVVCNPRAPEEAKEALQHSIKPYIGSHPTKKDLVEATRVRCRELAKKGYKLELYIERRNHKLGRGSYSKSTYGGDPERSKG